MLQRNFTANQLDILLKDCATLNLSKYLSEVVSSLMEAKLKFTDIPAATTLCTELNCTYTDFSPIFHEQWIKILCIKKDDTVSILIRARILIYFCFFFVFFFNDFDIIQGTFKYKPEIPYSVSSQEFKVIVMYWANMYIFALVLVVLVLLSIMSLPISCN